MPGNTDLAFAGSQDSTDDLHGRRLTGTIWAEKPQYLPTIEIKTNIFDSTVIAVVPVKSFN